MSRVGSVWLFCMMAKRRGHLPGWFYNMLGRVASISADCSLALRATATVCRPTACGRGLVWFL